MSRVNKRGNGLVSRVFFTTLNPWLFTSCAFCNTIGMRQGERWGSSIPEAIPPTSADTYFYILRND